MLFEKLFSRPFDISVLVIIWAGMALLVWGLVQLTNSGYQSFFDCSDRLTESGFQGNPDFYGLGIRLGIYLQWVAQCLASMFLLDEWKNISAASVTFALALTVAMFILTFEHECTFTAEIIVVLFIFWGCLYISSYDVSPARSKPEGTLLNPHPNFTGLTAAFVVPYFIMQIFGLWFWARLATAGEVDYSPTPGGTFYFLFSRVSTTSKPPAQFLVALYALMVFGIIMAYVVFPGMKFTTLLYKKCFNTLDWGKDKPDTLRAKSGQRAYLPGQKALKTIKEWYEIFRKGYEEVSSRQTEVPISTIRTFYHCVSAVFIVYFAVSVELTLVWNNISGVYDVSSTGQVIPLIVGAGLLVSVLWKLRHRWQTEPESFELDSKRAAFQNPHDGRWL